MFIVGLFFLKNKTKFQSESSLAQGGLVYSGDEQVGDLVNRDTDQDGVPDWEESLYGTDPTKKDTNGDGVPDNVEVARMQGASSQNGEINFNAQGGANGNSLTQTDQLSQELFSTVAALNQAGQIDQNTVDTLSNSIAEKVQNSAPRKIFLLADLKITQNDDRLAVKNYNDTLNSIYSKYPLPKNTVVDVLSKFVIDENNVDESVLPQLDPIIKQTNNIINAMATMKVPASLAPLHLDMLNALEKLSENVSDIRQYDTDIIIAISGISQYQTSNEHLQVAINNLASAISVRLK